MPAQDTKAPCLPDKLFLQRTHPTASVRESLLELVTEQSNAFGIEEAMFFAAPEGSDRALLAYEILRRYNSHAADQQKIKALTDALEYIIGTTPAICMNGNARMSDPDHIKCGWNVHIIARRGLAALAAKSAQ